MTNAHVVQLRTASEDQILAWLGSQPSGTVHITVKALADRFGWHRNRMGRKLQGWAATGVIKRRGKMIQIVQKNAPVQLVTAQCTAPRSALAGALPKLLAAVMILCGLLLTGALFGMNLSAWGRFAEDAQSALLLQIIGGVVDLLVVILPATTVGARFRTAVSIWCVWAICLLIVLWTAVGFTSGNIGDAVGAREHTIARRATVQKDIDGLRAKIAELPMFVVTTDQEVNAAVAERVRQCESGRYCTKARMDERNKLSDYKFTIEYKRLKAELEAKEKDLEKIPIIATADPQISGPIKTIAMFGITIPEDKAKIVRDLAIALILILLPSWSIRRGVALIRG